MAHAAQGRQEHTWNVKKITANQTKSLPTQNATKQRQIDKSKVFVDHCVVAVSSFQLGATTMSCVVGSVAK